MMSKAARFIFLALSFFVLCASADDIDVYLKSKTTSVNSSFLMLMFDYHPDMFSTFCPSLTECVPLLSEEVFSQLCAHKAIITPIKGVDPKWIGSRDSFNMPLVHRPDLELKLCADYYRDNVDKDVDINNMQVYSNLDVSSKQEVFSVFIATLSVVIKDVSGINVGLMVSNKNDGGTILQGFRPLLKNDSNHTQSELLETLWTISKTIKKATENGVAHKLRSRETFYEMLLYFNGKRVNKHTSTTDNFIGNIGTPGYDTKIMKWVTSAACGSRKVTYDGWLINSDGKIDFITEPPAGCANARSATHLVTDKSALSDRKVGSWIPYALAKPEEFLSPFATGDFECSKFYSLVMAINDAETDQDADIGIINILSSLGNKGVNEANDGFANLLAYMAKENTDLIDNHYVDGIQNMTTWIGSVSMNSNYLDDWADAGANTKANTKANKSKVLQLTNANGSASDFEKELRNIFLSVLNTSATFVAASVPINIVNQTRALDDFYLALFQAQATQRWQGNIKKLALYDAYKTGEMQVFDVFNLALAKAQAAVNCKVSGKCTAEVAISPIDGRIKQDALTFWTDANNLPPLTPAQMLKKLPKNTDGREVTRGGAGQKIPEFISGEISFSNAVDTRQIYTDIGGALTPLNGTDTVGFSIFNHFALNAIDQQWVVDTARINTAGLSVDALNAKVTKSLIHFIRGVDIASPVYDYDSALGKGPARDWILGDILHSKPLAINYGEIGAWNDKSDAKDDNPYVSVIFGANDGGLHILENNAANGEETGVETYAFYPSELLNITIALARNESSSNNLGGAGKHPYGVDGEVSAFVFYDTQDTTSNPIDTIDAGTGDYVHIFTGLRRGGKSIYALDVTDPFNPPKLIGSIKKAGDFAELGLTFSKPIPVLVKYDGNVTTALIFAGGYDHAKDDDSANGNVTHGSTPDSEGNAIYIVNAKTMELIWKSTVGNGRGVSNTLFEHPDMKYAIPSTVKPIDSDSDGFMDRMYVGDVAGNVWRGDFPVCNKTPCINHRKDNWTMTKIAALGDASAARAVDDIRFFHPPAVTFTRDAIGGDYDAVVIGSGDRANPLEETDENWIFMLKDRNTLSGSPSAINSKIFINKGVPTIDEQALSDMTTCVNNVSTCGTPVSGWKIKLSTGEKALSSPMIISGKIHITTFDPVNDAVDKCLPKEGVSKLYTMNLANASAMRWNSKRFVEISAGISGDVTVAGNDIIFPGSVPTDFLDDSDGSVNSSSEIDEKTIMDSGVTGVDMIYWREPGRDTLK